jgi:hypothetical protein
MGLGAPSIATNQKREVVSGPPFSVASADNGLSVDTTNGKIVLGNDFGDPLQPALLVSDREIPYGPGGVGLFLTQASGARTTLTPTTYNCRIDDPGTVQSQIDPGKVTLTDNTGLNPFIDFNTGNNDVRLQNLDGIVSLLCSVLGTGVVFDLVNARMRLFNPVAADNGQTLQVNGNMSLQKDFIVIPAFPLTPGFTSSDVVFGLAFGALPGDVVQLGIDPASVLPNSSFTAWISAADTLTVRFNNYGAAAQQPPNGNFNVSIIRIT